MIRAAWLIALMLCIDSVTATATFAAEKYEIDEDIEVFFLNSWIPAKARDCNKKGEVLAEFVFANALKHEIFAPEKVRHLYESGAIARARLWSDASGKFKVKAALLKVSGGKVTLRTEQSKEVVIALEKLSTKDQTFLKQFQQKAGLAALPVPELPPLVEFDTSSAVTTTGLSKRPGQQDAQAIQEVKLALTSDPVRKGLELKQAGVGFPTSGFGERLSSLIALGGTDNWMLASVGEDSRQPTRLLWAALAKDSIKKIQMLPAGEMVIDYHAASRQMLTYSQRRSVGNASQQQLVITIWQTDPATDEPKAVVSWLGQMPDDKSWGHSAPWLRFASASHVIQRTNTHRLIAWDIASRRMAWTTPQESFFAPQPQLSAGGKYVFLPEDGGLRIVDSASGATVGELPMRGCSGVGVHRNGSLIAVANQNEIFVIDITGQQSTRKVNAESVGSPFSMTFDWVADNFLCFDKGHEGYVLFSLEHGLPMWTYTFDADAYWAHSSNGGRQRSIVDDHLVYAATFQIQGKRGMAVGAVELPGPKAQAAIAAVQREDFLAIKEGSSMRIEVVAMDHASEIREALTKELTANGWVYDENSSNVLKAEYKRGETREVRYEMQSLRSGDRQTQSVSVTPFIASLKLMVDAEEAWQSTSSTAPPPIVAMKEGTSLQSEVDRWTQPNWTFYQSLDIPAEIIDPKKRGGVGKTSVTNRGLLEQPLEQ